MRARSTRLQRVRRPLTNALVSGERSIGCGCRVDRKTLDQFDHLETLPGFKFKEGLQQSQAFDGFARWSSELLMQLRNKCGIFHLAPFIGNGNGIPEQT